MARTVSQARTAVRAFVRAHPDLPQQLANWHDILIQHYEGDTWLIEVLVYDNDITYRDQFQIDELSFNDLHKLKESENKRFPFSAEITIDSPEGSGKPNDNKPTTHEQVVAAAKVADQKLADELGWELEDSTYKPSLPRRIRKRWHRLLNWFGTR